MAKTFNQMVQDTLAQVPTVSPTEAQKHLRDDPNTLVIDDSYLSSHRISAFGYELRTMEHSLTQSCSLLSV